MGFYKERVPLSDDEIITTLDVARKGAEDIYTKTLAGTPVDSDLLQFIARIRQQLADVHTEWMERRRN